jgi:hypothetical protein
VITKCGGSAYPGELAVHAFAELEVKGRNFASY